MCISLAAFQRTRVSLPKSSAGVEEERSYLRAQNLQVSYLSRGPAPKAEKLSCLPCVSTLRVCAHVLPLSMPANSISLLQQKNIIAMRDLGQIRIFVHTVSYSSETDKRRPSTNAASHKMNDLAVENRATRPGATLVNLVLPYREPNRCREVLVKRHGDELVVVEDTVQSPWCFYLGRDPQTALSLLEDVADCMKALSDHFVSYSPISQRCAVGDPAENNAESEGTHLVERNFDVITVVSSIATDIYNKQITLNGKFTPSIGTPVRLFVGLTAADTWSDRSLVVRAS
ncbi:hypothetical protein KCU95_g107, partial [Aureobasidium melanogenum]